MLKIFICSTPYHVMLSHLVLECIQEKERLEETKKILILTESALSNTVNEIIDNSFWNQILRLPFYETLNFLKTKKFIDSWVFQKNIGKTNLIKEVFINDDKRWRNQLVVTGIKPDKLSLIEDGLGAYFKNKYNFWDKIYRGIVLKFVFKSRLMNAGVISSIPADRFFAFRDTAFSWYGPHRKLSLLDYKNSKYIERIVQKDFIKNEIQKSAKVKLIILTSPMTEGGTLTSAQECIALKNSTSFLPKPDFVGIKPHPREKRKFFNQRLKILSEAFKNSKIIKLDSTLPAELLLCHKDTTADIFSLKSTTLANIKTIRPDLTIYHGAEMFSSNKKYSDSLLLEYFNELGILSLKDS